MKLKSKYKVFIEKNAFEYVDDLVQDCSNSIANALELLQSFTKPSMWSTKYWSLCSGVYVWNDQVMNKLRDVFLWTLGDIIQLFSTHLSLTFNNALIMCQH